jgi:hypothetical protein
LPEFDLKNKEVNEASAIFALRQLLLLDGELVPKALKDMLGIYWVKCGNRAYILDMVCGLCCPNNEPKAKHSCVYLEKL